MNNKKKWISITLIIVLLTNALTFYVTDKFSFAFAGGKISVSKSQNADLSKFDKLFTVRDRLYKYYDGKIDDDVLAEGAIKGMTAALKDPYTVYMNKKEYTDFNTQTVGAYTGLGIQVGVKDDKIVVIAPFDDSPAKKAGILSGDTILKVNGKEYAGSELEAAVAVMKVAEGTELTLSLSRPGKGNFDVKLKTAEITLVTVKGEMLNDGIGYIQITMFDENTSANFEKKLKELQAKNMKGLILDLRGNPGGLLDQCVKIASNFIPKGKVIVSTIDKNKIEDKYNSIGGNDKAIGLPMTILTDEGTASASEIVSGAMRDYKLATLVGTKTFGKGIVQTMLTSKLEGFGDGTALKVTISKYYTPNGENIQGTGIKPDVNIPYPEALKSKTYDRNADPQFAKALEIVMGKVK